MKRTIATAVGLGALALPAAAQSHVSLHPNTLPAASNPTLNVRVPNEETNANAVKVDMQVPPGFLDVTTQLPPGWTAQVIKTKLAQPLKTDTGTVTEQVSEVIWTARKGGGIPPGSFLQFPILTAIPDGDTGQALTFKVVQTYSNGDVVRWIGPPSADKPAPTVNVTAKGGVLEDVAGTEAGPPPLSGGKSTATHVKSKAASHRLGVIALIAGIAGLAVALVAAGLALARRPRAAAAS